jgi:hypothetical protein
MPVIEARPADEKVTEKVPLRLMARDARVLKEYADAIKETPDYVVGKLIEKFLTKDKKARRNDPAAQLSDLRPGRSKRAARSSEDLAEARTA